MSGGGKETPRQKMIGMMYLVLTAMLALNVSAEVLNAFGLFEKGLSQTVKIFREKNDVTEAGFRAADTENHERVGKWLEKSLAVRAKSEEIIAFMESLKVEMVLVGDGPEAPAVQDGHVHGDHIINVSSTEPSSRCMVALQRGVELKQKLEEHRQYLISMADPEATSLIATIESLLATNDVESTHDAGKVLPWEVGTFSDLPLIAVVPLITQMQVNILTCEADMMSYFMKQTDVGTIKIDNFDPIIQPVTDYVVRGGKFEAKVFLAASDKTLEPEVVVNGQKLRTVEGKAKYETMANHVGEQTLKGVITLNGKPYPFTYHYMVAEPSVVVSPSKMNVLYRGVENPIDVSAAGIPDSKIQITITNGTLKKEGSQYVAVPGPGKICDIGALAEINGVKSDMGSRQFRVKNVPTPTPSIDGIEGKTASRSQLEASQGIRTVMPPDFEFDLKFTVKSFVVFASIDGYVREEIATSAMFTDKQRQIMKKIQPGQRLSITDIKAIGPGGKEFDLSDISVKVR
ncbi:MAG: gliding motility protein GldM [Prevotellaceae bacterium]|jgi:gliding motility-associated protein GldM|nr:gliding motility protein GldM [Prevotellaceae bacterium]